MTGIPQQPESLITQLLQKIDREPTAAADLLPVVYDELRQLAAQKMALEKPGQTLQATALVHEAWLKLVDVEYAQKWSSRRHFFGAAAEAMRRILIDQARRKKRQKHGGDFQQVTIELENIPAVTSNIPVEQIDEALTRFAAVDSQACELVKLRYFAGLSLREAAETLEIPSRSADRLWAYAKAWLMREIQDDSV